MGCMVLDYYRYVKMYTKARSAHLHRTMAVIQLHAKSPIIQCRAVSIFCAESAVVMLADVCSVQCNTLS